MFTKHLGKISFVVCVITLAASLSLAAPGSVYAATKTRMTIGTGNSGGVFYVLGAAMANVITKQSDLIELTAQATTATTENLNFVNSNNLDFGFSLFDVAHCAYTGTREYESVGKLKNLRVVVLGHVGLNTATVFKKSSIKSIGDLKPGKHVIPCSSGYTGFLLAETALYGYGLKLPKNAPVLSFTEMVSALKDNTIDVMIYHGAHPASSIFDAASAFPIRILGHTPESLARIFEKYPYYVKATIPAGMYTGQETDIITFGTPYAIVCHKDAPDDVVLEFIKVVFSTDWAAYHESGSYYTAKNAFYKDLYVDNPVKTMIPFHPAAKAYLESLGIGNLSTQ